MSAPRIQIEFDVSEFRGRFSVEADDFYGKTAEEIEAELNDLVDEHAKANVSFHAQNVAATVAAIQAAHAEAAKANQSELIEQFEAGNFGDVEFTELALEAGIDLATIEKTLQSQREGELA